jgi:hypothetical protein
MYYEVQIQTNVAVYCILCRGIVHVKVGETEYYRNPASDKQNINNIM